MNLLLRWWRSGTPQRSAGDGADPGDMGTAFGLDASLAALDEEPGASDAEEAAENRWRDRLERRPNR